MSAEWEVRFDPAAADLLGSRQEVRDAMSQIAEAMAEEMRANAPVDTGELAGSIEAHADGEGYQVGATAPHAAHVEYGTMHMSAQPYIRPALDRRYT